MSFGARASIRLDALQSNFERLKAAGPSCKVIAAVKANAYGHGLTKVASALPGADALGVARLPEAEQLRAAGIQTPLLLMGGVISAPELRTALELDCDLVVHSEFQVELLETFGRCSSRAWLKVDTGMGRLGVRPEEAPALMQRLRRISGLESPGLMTHLANADDRQDRTSEKQIARFARLSDGFDGDISIGNSAALLGWADAINPSGAKTPWNHSGDTWIRPGISLYGISPLVGVSAAELGLRAVMQFETVLIAVKSIRAGEHVGYGGHWVPSEDTVVGIAAAGYGDGYSRFIPSGTPVLVNGRRVAVAGVISMDLTAIDLGPDATERTGDRVILWGDALPVEEVAACAETTAYPLVTGVVDRTGELR